MNAPSKSNRLDMAKAAHFAGKAINITKTTAPHAISYPLTSFFAIPHGHGASLTLSSMLIYNYDVCDSDVSDTRGTDYVRKTIQELIVLLGAKNIFNAKEIIDTLMHNIGLETKLSLLGVKTKQDIETIIENGFNPNRVRNNPRIVTETVMRAILYNIW